MRQPAPRDPAAHEPPHEPRVFVLRIWRQPAAFRAALREVAGDETRLFSRAADLARFARALWADPDGGPPGAPPAQPATPPPLPPSRSGGTR